MKRFKRISIVLIIFLILLLTLFSLWILYPINHIGVSKTDIIQTEELLDKHDINVPDVFLKKGVSSLVCPTVKYRTDNREKIVKDILGEEAVQKDDYKYLCKDTELEIDGKNIIINGLYEDFRDITLDDVSANAKKLIESLDLDKTNMTIHAYSQDEGFFVTAIPEYKNRSVFDEKMKLYVESDGSYRLEATPVIFSRPTKKILPLTPCMALSELALTGDADDADISEMQLGYKTSGSSLIPVWEIISDDNLFYIE